MHDWRRFSLALMLTLGLVACRETTTTPVDDTDPMGDTSPDPDPTPEALISWTFDADLDGWSAEVTPGPEWGTVDWLDREGGLVKFDGVGFSGSPNGWISIDVDLPATAGTLRYRSSAHDRGDGAASLRIRLVPSGAASVTIQDWEELSTGAEGFEFIDSQVDISAWAGQSVTLFFEHGDIDGGGNNQRYVDDIEIWS